MQINITKRYEFMNGWTAYDMTWKTELPGLPNQIMMSVSVVSRNPFSTKILKDWASEKGYNLDTVFTDYEKGKEDCEKMKKFYEEFNEVYGKNLDAILSDNKCYVRYTATLNPNYKPLKTAFETIDIYTVEVKIEFKGHLLIIQFPSQGRKQNEDCPFILVSGGEMKELYGEEDAIYKISSRIGQYIKDCDTDQKFRELFNKLTEVKKELEKYY